MGRSHYYATSAMRANALHTSSLILIPHPDAECLTHENEQKSPEGAQ
jgi:hypothetical protein